MQTGDNGMRNINPFTERQVRLVKAVRDKLVQIDDPNPDIITTESYEFHIVATKQFGRIPKIKFKPDSCRIKAELARESGIVDEAREIEIARLRQSYGLSEARNSRARLFEEEWNNIMLKAKKSAFAVALINQLFATNMNQSVSDPIQLLQQIIMGEYAPQINAKKDAVLNSRYSKSSHLSENQGMKPYDKELSELE